ncbi:hypothetical protein BCF74_1349 [Knoellia remsis]|uniref:Uncharacterized protein n=1 Tax=Knoellia remsis TaxID=407159 RepID=A0A2T0U2T9_9MICO|nr:hypothetical protein [Knoellia remsis]PRY52230.1 hypothetical protein BCF74_1349 [Knoellia remsis]
MKAGFGQRDEYVWVSAVVRNNSTYVGQTVTVNFNVLDDKGAVLKSGSQVEGFSRPEGEHVVGTQLDLAPGQKAAKVEATLDVEAVGAFSDKPFPELPTSKAKIEKSEFGGVQASFEVSNPTQEVIKDARIGLACLDSAGKVIGGAADFPELIPAGGKIRVDADVIASSQPADCTVFVGAPSDWEGNAAAPSASAQAPATSAENAFKTWIDQFTKKDWSAQYDTMVSPQKKLLSKADYVRCRNSEAVPSIKWSKALSATDVGPTDIPGTDKKVPATKVSAQVIVDGLAAPIDAHMYAEDGQWKWSMSQENVDNCVK